MVYFKDFIWEDDCMGYHVTSAENMASIQKEGLKPLLGERSRAARKIFKGIHFTYSLSDAVEEWMQYLYQNRDIESLEVLRFNLKGLKWITGDVGDYFVPGDWYLVKPLLPEYIEYLRVLNNGNLEHADYNNNLYDQRDNRVWLPVKEYKINTK